MKKANFLLTLLFTTIITLPGSAQELVVTDLGQVGKVTPLENLEAIKQNNEINVKEELQPQIEAMKKELRQHLVDLQQKRGPLHIEMSFHTSLPRHYGRPLTTIKNIDPRIILPIGNKILFFSTENIIKPCHFKDVFAAYCLSYRSLEDIGRWKEKHEVTFPVQPLTDDSVCHTLGVEAYPATVTIKGDGKIEVTQFQEAL